MDFKAKSRGRHYTFYGLSLLNTDDESEPYRKRWVVHANVDEEDVVTVSRFEKSKKNGRSYAADQMRYLSVRNYIFSCSLYLLMPFQGPFVL